jgi:murein DD-endopeptidase
MFDSIKNNVGLLLKHTQTLLKRLPKLHAYLIVCLALVCALLFLFPITPYQLDRNIKLPALYDPQYTGNDEPLINYSYPQIAHYELIVEEGQSLSVLLEKIGVPPNSTVDEIKNADINVLTIDLINTGDKYRFWVDDYDDYVNSEPTVLRRMEQVLGPEHQVVFERKKNGFEYSDVILEGQWKERVVIGEVKPGSNFGAAASDEGLPYGIISESTRLLNTKINFKKIQAGTKFQLVVSDQYIDGVLSGQSRLDGIRLLIRNNVYSAFSYEGNYFDSDGNGLEEAFTRYPVKGKYRISSNFNPRRRHPITRLIRPHNGTDFAVRTGTPVYAPGDGLVSRVVRHKYAGLYIEIKHGEKYKTRYLHLSKALVKKGQYIKRGQKIALSGNTGASTGAHLHYEFHVNQKPINAMGKNVPVVVGVEKKAKAAFASRVARLIKMMRSQA